MAWALTSYDSLAHSAFGSMYGFIWGENKRVRGCDSPRWFVGLH